MDTLLFTTPAWIICLLIMIIMLVCIKAGSLIGKKKINHEDYVENAANNTIFGSVVGLFAFLLAFSFSMSGSRFDARRTATITEANAIGTAILRADLYPQAEREAFRKDFKAYLEVRINYLTAVRKENKMDDVHKEQDKISQDLWQRAMRLSVNAPSVVPANLMTPALNDMFDSATANDYSELMRVPESIVIMLFLLSFVSAFFVGYISAEKGKLDRYVAFGFCFLSALVIFITLDLDRPRRGLIKLNTSHEAITSLREQFK